jgi:hypothetical protein
MPRLEGLSLIVHGGACSTLTVVAAGCAIGITTDVADGIAGVTGLMTMARGEDSEESNNVGRTDTAMDDMTDTPPEVDG